jgi:hypothetical protein
VPEGHVVSRVPGKWSSSRRRDTWTGASVVFPHWDEAYRAVAREARKIMANLRRPAAASSIVAFVALYFLAFPAAASTGGGTLSASNSELSRSGAALDGELWLAKQLTPEGFVPSSPGSSQPSLSSTAQTVLALSASRVDLTGAEKGLSYLEGHVDQYVFADGSDGPGELALLILDAEALGVDPTSFGGTNLISRLLITQENTGPDAGLFGTATQVADYSAGSYAQGLALAALGSAGVHDGVAVANAAQWLVDEQCPDGGWTLPDKAANPCHGSASLFEGPDTNATSFAVQGLAAEGVLSDSAKEKALAFLSRGQDSDGGWSYFPNTQSVPGTTDPDSTALVIQALLALGSSPTGTSYYKGSANPESALLSFQLTSGSESGSFFYPGNKTANVIATYEAVPALLDFEIPWSPIGDAYWEVASDGGVFSFGDAGYYGSMGGRPLDMPVVGITPTPDGRGYWEVASDGGVFSFGDGGYYGSMGGRPLDMPIVGIGAGYARTAS